MASSWTDYGSTCCTVRCVGQPSQSTDQPRRQAPAVAATTCSGILQFPRRTKLLKASGGYIAARFTVSPHISFSLSASEAGRLGTHWRHKSTTAASCRHWLAPPLLCCCCCCCSKFLARHSRGRQTDRSAGHTAPAATYIKTGPYRRAVRTAAAMAPRTVYVQCSHSILRIHWSVKQQQQQQQQRQRACNNVIIRRVNSTINWCPTNGTSKPAPTSTTKPQQFCCYTQIFTINLLLYYTAVSEC